MAAGPTAVTQIDGYSGRVYVSTDGAAFTEIAQLENVDLNIMADFKAADNHATARAGWKRKKPGLLDWTASASTLRATDDAGNQAILDALINRTPLMFRFDPEDTAVGKPRYSGQAYIKGWKESSPTSDFEKINVDFEGDGPLAVADQAA